MARKYALKGINDEATECTICGKIELKRVMWLVELDADGNEIGNAFHCGTTCGANLMGAKISKVRTAVKNYKAEAAAKRMYLQASHPATKEMNTLLDKLNELGLYGPDRWNHPLFDKMDACRKEARNWAQAQQILIEVV